MGDEGGSKRRKRYWWLALLLVLALPVLFLRWHGIAITPAQWWYPFPVAVFSGHYSAGPFALTSNTREDNPVWPRIAAFNEGLARLSYVATLGRPQAQVAWLFPAAEWPDAPAFSFFGVDPNARESGASRALFVAGLEYDRISRRDLLAAAVEQGRLAVGQAHYEALLVTDLRVASPELLDRVIALARQGVPVIWQGEFPARAHGWADHEARDREVRAQGAELRSLVIHSASAEGLAAGFAAARLRPVLAPADGGAMRLRMHRRLLGEEQFILLFNESGHALTERYALDGSYARAELLDPESGAIAALALEAGTDAHRVQVAVPARRTRILHLGAARDAAASAWQPASWQSPPRALRPFARWWWPGNAVEPEELRRELRSLHAAGFGGVELQTLTLGFRLAELRREAERIYQVGTPAYFANVRTVFEEAARLGMTVDLTLGSGWSSGGPFIERYPERQLIAATLDVQGPQALDVPLPPPAEPGYVARTNQVIRNTIGAFDDTAALAFTVAARVDTDTDPPTLAEPVDIGGAVSDGRIRWRVPAGRHRIFAIYQNATAHNAAGSAYPGALERSRILDHLDRGGVEEYLAKLGDPWLAALRPHRPDAVFVDSFELIAELPWSARFAAAFRDMHGYDIAPWLPLVFRRSGESKYTAAFAPPAPAYRAGDERAERIREDYEATREALFRDMFLQPLKEWAAANGVRLRLQAHGGYGDYLDGYQLADIPESESLFAGGSFDFLKLASSAAHVAGRPVASAESFIVMAPGFDSLDIEDYHLLAGNAFAAGINRIVYHGYAYHFPLQ